MRHTTAFILFWLVVLGGCAGAGRYGPDSPHYAYPPGARLVLQRALEIPPDAATVRLQFGRVVARNAVQEQEPHCIFEIDTVRTEPQAVAPDSFEIVGVRRSIRTFAGIPALAARPAMTLRVHFAEDDSPTQIFYKTEFRLRSDRQPGVRRLICQSDQNAPGVGPFQRHLTLGEIRAALGGVFTLRLP